MGLQRILLWLVAAGCIVAAFGLWWSYRPALPPRAADAAFAYDNATIDRGAELASIGDCISCHTAPGRPAFSGGNAMATPFGTIYASNITPDMQTGIGTWTEKAFLRALRDGVDREGRQLYPAFPYDHFKFTTDEDAKRIYAFLMSRPAVASKTPPNALSFPFNIRTVVAGWKVLFLRQGALQPVPGQSEAWNRGRYLVEGLGHCGSCHTPRNALGAEKKDSRYAGAQVDGWTAPPLNASLVKAHKWSVDDLADYLSTGWQRNHGAAAGPMAAVAKNLGRASQGDVRALATYIASLSAAAPAPKAILPKDGRAVPGASAATVALYDGACAKCHNASGDIGPSQALPLGLSTAVQGPNSASAARAVMHGIKAFRLDGGPYMPAFDNMFTNAQIVDLLRYVRARYSEQPAWSGIESEVTKARKEVAAP